MKKQCLYLGLFLLFTGFSLSSHAQGNVNIQRGFGNNEAKNVSKARFVALANTALSVGTGLAAVNLFENNSIQKAGALLGVYGVVMAPATGNMYAEDYPRALIGVGARAAGAFLMIDATREVFGDQFADQLNVDSKEVSLTDTKILIGEALILGGFIYNLLSAKASVEEYNAGKSKFSLNVSPTVVDDKVAPVLTANFNF